MPDTLSFTKDYVFHTIQGEGIYQGEPSVFVRLSGCNLRCEWQNPDQSYTRCDTPYSSFEPEKNIHTIGETVSFIHQLNTTHVVVTGGEPFLQPKVKMLINQLVELGHFVTVETNGTIFFETQAQFYSISPKLSSSQHTNSPHFYSHQKTRENLEVLAQLTEKNHQLKFVVNSKEDLMEIETLLKKIKEVRTQKGFLNKKLQVVLMPQGVSLEQIHQRSEWLIEECKKRGYRYSDRLHIRLWGSRRGI